MRDRFFRPFVNLVTRYTSQPSFATTMKVGAGIASGFAAGSAFQSYNHSTARTLAPAPQQPNIHKALQKSPQEMQTILAEEETGYDRVKKELQGMKVLLSKKEIKQRVAKMGKEIAEKYKDEKHLLVLTMLQGATYFSTDLKRELDRNGLLFKEDAIRLTRYGNSHQGGDVKIERLPSPEAIIGRKILIVEDLIEQGVTLQETIDELVKRGAKREDISIAAFTNKTNERKKGYENLQPDFYSYTMKINQWVVGYGCDQSSLLRSKEDLLYFPEEEQQKFGYGK